jgi:phosphoribosylpyrophosphate synthetase
VDDICDGGRTFVPIIEDLLDRGAKSVNLCVTHALLPYGLDSLLDAGLSNFFYVNSFLDKDLPKMYPISQINNVIKGKLQ